ncbi:MAG: hypothetical protein M3O09_04985 [Acidobacteriota bacterium]|nr:hypothetical protein [Acidobacteriota bacterium]
MRLVRAQLQFELTINVYLQGVSVVPGWIRNYATGVVICACFGLMASSRISAQTATVGPVGFSFGSVVVGISSTVKNVVFKNGQTTAITIAAITAASADYGQTSNCPTLQQRWPLAAGRTRTNSVTFAPQPGLTSQAI